ncbi:hypothetical protein GCM10009582_11260 [Arthrobacter flavus]
MVAITLKIYETFNSLNGCGKGLSIAASCNEMPGLSGISFLVHRMNSRGPLGSHLGFNKGSFSGAFPFHGKVTQALCGGSRG